APVRAYGSTRFLSAMPGDASLCRSGRAGAGIQPAHPVQPAQRVDDEEIAGEAGDGFVQMCVGVEDLRRRHHSLWLLTPYIDYGVINHMKASLLHRSRTVHRNGIIEAVVWQVPRPVPPSEHPYKYRLVYVVNGQRVVGYDNERGKGDHRHLRGVELPY